MQRLRDAAEQAKIALSDQMSVDIALSNIMVSPEHPSVDMDVTITRNFFDKLCADQLRSFRLINSQSFDSLPPHSQH